MSWPYVDGVKFCIYLRSLNFRQFRTAGCTGLKIWRQYHVQWHDPSLLKIIRIYQLVRKILVGDAQTGRGIDNMVIT
jgi:hypothetical protein